MVKCYCKQIYTLYISLEGIDVFILSVSIQQELSIIIERSPAWIVATV